MVFALQSLHSSTEKPLAYEVWTKCQKSLFGSEMYHGWGWFGLSWLTSSPRPRCLFLHGRRSPPDTATQVPITASHSQLLPRKLLAVLAISRAVLLGCHRSPLGKYRVGRFPIDLSHRRRGV